MEKKVEPFWRVNLPKRPLLFTFPGQVIGGWLSSYDPVRPIGPAAVRVGSLKPSDAGKSETWSK